MPYIKKTKKRPSVTKRAKIIAAGSAAVAAVLAFGGLYLQQQETIDSNAAQASQFTPAPLPTETPTVSVSDTPAASPTELAGIISSPEDTVISVLGDSTGNGAEEWVGLWAEHLSQYGTITLHMWDGETDAWEPEPITYPGGERNITIWNGSKSGVTYAYPLERMPDIQPDKPDLTILNLGHNIGEKRADQGAQEILAAMQTRWGTSLPVAVTLQNPAQGERQPRTAGSVSSLREWATSAAIPTIDVNAAFEKAGDLPSLLADEVHPNPDGQQLWVETVVKAVG